MSSIGVVSDALKTLPELALVPGPALAPAPPPGVLPADQAWRAPAPSSSLPSGRHAGRQRRAQPVTDRVRRDGKFFRLGAEKFHVKGVTYGPFAPDSAGCYMPDPAQVRRDF